MRIALSCALAALACTGPARPRDVRAFATGGAVEVQWEPAPLVTAYRVQLVDFDTGAAVSAPVVVHANRATLPGIASGVWVDALPGERAMSVVSSGSGGGTGAPWQMFAPWDFRGGVLQARFAQVSPDERVAVLLVNAGGPDDANADVAIDGTAAVAAAGLAVSTAALAVPPASPHEIVRAQEMVLAGERVAPREPVAAADHRSFCIVPGLDFSRHLRKPATRTVSAANVDVYVDDDDLGHYEGDLLPALAQALDAQVWPAVTGVFGSPTDVDGNGKILVVLSHELGAHLNGGWLIGYFGNADLVRSRDDACTGSGSNHGEIVYLNDVSNGALNGYAAPDLAATVYPATFAHELQHLLNFAHRCVERSCDGPEETWINEALSKVAEDVAGFGWNAAGGRAEGTAYLGRSYGTVRGYDARSLTKWEGDPIGNYQGAHSFLRFFADRDGAEIAARIARGPGGVDGVEAALGRPLPRAMAEWATALLVSNEVEAEYSFSGNAWSPLHQRLRHLDTRDPGPVALRADGIAAVLSGAGQGGPALVTVRSAASPAPYVVVVRVSASLPAR